MDLDCTNLPAVPPLILQDKISQILVLKLHQGLQNVAANKATGAGDQNFGDDTVSTIVLSI